MRKKDNDDSYYMYSFFNKIICRWKTLEQAIECIKYYSIYLYYIIAFLFFFQGIPNLFTGIHLYIICILTVKQILYKETKCQWIVCSIFYMILFFVKYISLLPAVNKLIFQKIEMSIFVRKQWIHPFEFGFVPYSFILLFPLIHRCKCLDKISLLFSRLSRFINLCYSY